MIQDVGEMDEVVSVHQTHLGLPTVGMEAVLTLALSTPSAPECGDGAVDFACRTAVDPAAIHPSDDTVLAAFGATLVDEGRLDPSVRGRSVYIYAPACSPGTMLTVLLLSLPAWRGPGKPTSPDQPPARASRAAKLCRRRHTRAEGWGAGWRTIPGSG